MIWCCELCYIGKEAVFVCFCTLAPIFLKVARSPGPSRCLAKPELRADKAVSWKLTYYLLQCRLAHGCICEFTRQQFYWRALL